MKSPIALAIVLLLAFLLALSGCSSGMRNAESVSSAPPAQNDAGSVNRSVAKVDVPATESTVALPNARQQSPDFQEISLNQADTAAAAAEAADRKIIRNANLTLEVNSTTQAQQKVTSIA
jgi:PBP1b-binding outer membrane lipoprotein LpoB